jgi:hypothetical protein
MHAHEEELFTYCGKIANFDVSSSDGGSGAFHSLIRRGPVGPNVTLIAV